MPNMIALAGGPLLLGHNRPNRLPVQLDVDPFELADAATTLGEWTFIRDLANANGYSIPAPGGALGNAHPVQLISALDIVAWLNAASERDGYTPRYLRPNDAVYRGGHGVPSIKLQPGNGYRLPREKEWEWAAREGGVRGGDELSGDINMESSWPRTYDPGAEIGSRITYTNGRPRTVPASAGAANSLGIYHMVGNTWEWVENMVKDARGEYADDEPSDDYAVVRGGSALSRGEITRPNTRDVCNLRFRLDFVGFRVARG